MALHLVLGSLGTNQYQYDDFDTNPASRHPYNYFDEDYVPGECVWAC